MTVIDITKAQQNLAALIEAATQGNEVIITRPDGRCLVRYLLDIHTLL